MVNITNKCTLRCKHCFVFREGNPNQPRSEMDSKTMLAKLEELQKRHAIQTMVWMGGEPMLRPDVLREGVKLFTNNHVTTNGTIDLIDLTRSIYVISIDGPPEIKVVPVGPSIEADPEAVFYLDEDGFVYRYWFSPAVYKRGTPVPPPPVGREDLDPAGSQDR